MNRQLWGVIAVFFAVTVSGCLTLKDAPNLAKLDLLYVFESKHRCGTTTPAMTIGNIPAGTKTLRLTMIDNDARNFDHGSATMEYSGSAQIPEGAFKGNFKGPCPPNTHNYTITVEAINAAGDTVLGRGQKSTDFPPK